MSEIAATYNKLDYAWQAYQPIIPLKWAVAHPEVAARSDADLNATKAHAGLPADTPDMRSLIGLEQPTTSVTKHSAAAPLK